MKRGTVSRVGTVCWMAPELLTNNKKYDQKVDIWAYGIFAMEIADGFPPYFNEPQARILLNIVKNDPPPINRRFSNDFQDFVKQCLTKDPITRPSAKQLLEHRFIVSADNYKEEFTNLI